VDEPRVGSPDYFRVRTGGSVVTRRHPYKTEVYRKVGDRRTTCLEATTISEHSAHLRVESWPAPIQAWVTVAFLTAAHFLSYVDRSILSLVVEPVKRSLHLSDTQIGLLQGPAFGVFFMLMTFPAGWLADRGNRTRLIAFGLTCWSIMTAFCGLCINFTQLFLGRMGVAIGEATLTPSGPSIISDNFPVERRTLPMSFYGLGALLGAGTALVAGGFVASLVGAQNGRFVAGIGPFEPWQIIFFSVGLPGLIFSLTFFLMREPQRRHQAQTQGTTAELIEVIKIRRAILIPHFAGVTLFQIYGSAFLAWLPAFFMRVHAWSMTDVGLRYGAIHLLFGFFGAAAGGLLARQLLRRGRRDANLLTASICFGGMAGPAILGTVASSALVSSLLLGLTMGFAQGAGGPNIAAIQEIIPNRLRGRVTAIYYAVMAVGGVTIGPLVIGLMDDYVYVDASSVGKSMSLTALLTLPASSVLLLIAARHRRKFLWVG
jgi:MFS family permease